ncbi:DUF2570 domain-containing protein [Brenneria roseae]|nr:DUF2570 domain-containing protein [Brenneria roseae]
MNIIPSWKITALALVVGIGIGWYITGLRWNADVSNRDSAASAANEQRAETITANVITSLRIINTITQANADAKQQIEQKSTERIVYIRQALSADDCAARPVPGDVVNRLREHADRIRSGASSADTSRTSD